MTGYPKASIPATEVRTLASSHVNQEFRISVALPYSYSSNPEKTFPTIYLLDANWYFGMVTEISRSMSLCGTLPETILVGIGYPVDDPLWEAFQQMMVLRTRDFTTIVNREEEKKEEERGRKVTTGGANHFLAFIESELIPLIEKEYRVTPGHRILAGHSDGGLFTLYALFHRTDLFKGYVAASPSLSPGNNVTFAYESTFAEQHKALPVKLYLGVGEREEGMWGYPFVSHVYQFVALMESRKYEGLALTRNIIANCDHCASVAPQFLAGLQAVLT